MVKTQHQQTDQCTQQNVDGIQQDQCATFLERGDIEESIDQFNGFGAFQRSQFQARQSKGQISRHSPKNALLNQFRNGVLGRTDHGQQRQKHQQRKTEDEQGLDVNLLLPSERDVLHHRIHRQRSGEIEQPGDY